MKVWLASEVHHRYSLVLRSVEGKRRFFSPSCFVVRAEKMKGSRVCWLTCSQLGSLALSRLVPATLTPMILNNGRWCAHAARPRTCTVSS